MKTLKKLLLVVLCLALSISTFACGKQTGPQIDDSKQQIYVYVTDDGRGYTWAEDLAVKFNALPENSNYQVVVRHGADAITTFSSHLEAKTTDINIFFGSYNSFTSMIEKGQLLDVSDIYEMKVDGTDVKIKDKMKYYEDYVANFRNVRGQGTYGIPYTQVSNGNLVFDYDFFLANDYMVYAETSELDAINTQAGSVVAETSGNKIKATVAFGNYEVGDYVLSKGKDGKYGTYDDGQHTTMEGFNSLISKIVRDHNVPYIYTAKYGAGYTEPIFTSLMAQTMGYENYSNFMKLSGELKDASGNTQFTFTQSNGADAWASDVVKNAYNDAAKFYSENIIGFSDIAAREKMVWGKTLNNKSSFSHQDAQAEYVMGFYTANADVGEPAFIVEGTWWEFEAKNSLVNSEKYGEGRGFGKREYRNYLLPVTENQIGAKDVTIISGDLSHGVLFNNIPEDLKVTKDEFIAKCKDFMAYTLTDENMAYYTEITGIEKPLRYSLSDAQYAKLTPYQKNTREMLSDTEHIKQVIISKNVNPIRSYGGIDNLMTESLAGVTSISYNSIYSFFNGVGNTDYNNYYLAVKANIDSDFANAKAMVDNYLNG